MNTSIKRVLAVVLSVVGFFMLGVSDQTLSFIGGMLIGAGFAVVFSTFRKRD